SDYALHLERRQLLQHRQPGAAMLVGESRRGHAGDKQLLQVTYGTVVEVPGGQPREKQRVAIADVLKQRHVRRHLSVRRAQKRVENLKSEVLLRELGRTIDQLFEHGCMLRLKSPPFGLGFRTGIAGFQPAPDWDRRLPACSGLGSHASSLLRTGI